MRNVCTSCARKHLSQALVLLLETYKGYPEHGWVAAGHMAEAEDELIPDYLEIAQAIRSHRVAYMNRLIEGERDYRVPVMDLIQMLNDTDPTYEMEIPDDHANTEPPPSAAVPE